MIDSIYYVMIAVVLMSMLTLMHHVGQNKGLSIKSRKWLCISLLTIMIGATTECIGTYMDGKNVPAALQIFIILTEFCTTPYISAFIAIAIGAGKQALFITVLMSLHTLAEVICIPWGYIFYIEKGGYYRRGPLYGIYVFSYSISVAFLIFTAAYLSRRFRRRDRGTLILSLLVLMTGVLPSVLNVSDETSFLGVSTMAILLYVYYSNLTEQDLHREIEDKSEHLSSIRKNVITRMACLIESRDSGTGIHIRSTSGYVKSLAEQTRSKNLYPDILTGEYIDWITEAAPLHDIGKVLIPDNILKKPGKLTPEEFEIMKTHAAEGERIVREILTGVIEEEQIRIASQIAGMHHERWDGKGYPNGISGEDIPLCARMMAIADVYDALTQERVYKKAMPREEAVRILLEGAGTQFDPVLVRIFAESCIGD